MNSVILSPLLSGHIPISIYFENYSISKDYSCRNTVILHHFDILHITRVSILFALEVNSDMFNIFERGSSL